MRFGQPLKFFLALISSVLLFVISNGVHGTLASIPVENPPIQVGIRELRIPIMRTVNPADSLEFQDFVSRVRDDSIDVARGIYVEGQFALSVLQQPEGDLTYVSTKNDSATEFKSASDNGITGILAHNYLSGAKFYNLQKGQEIRVVYGDGRYRVYRITGIYQYQRLETNNLRSDLIDLQTNQRVTTGQVFSRFYSGDHHLTLQTCLKANGISNWGLTFILAEPVLE